MTNTNNNRSNKFKEFTLDEIHDHEICRCILMPLLEISYKENKDQKSSQSLKQIRNWFAHYYHKKPNFTLNNITTELISSKYSSDFNNIININNKYQFNSELSQLIFNIILTNNNIPIEYITITLQKLYSEIKKTKLNQIPQTPENNYDDYINYLYKLDVFDNITLLKRFNNNKPKLLSQSITSKIFYGGTIRFYNTLKDSKETNIIKINIVRENNLNININVDILYKLFNKQNEFKITEEALIKQYEEYIYIKKKENHSNIPMMLSLRNDDIDKIILNFENKTKDNQYEILYENLTIKITLPDKAKYAEYNTQYSNKFISFLKVLNAIGDEECAELILKNLNNYFDDTNQKTYLLEIEDNNYTKIKNKLLANRNQQLLTLIKNDLLSTHIENYFYDKSIQLDDKNKFYASVKKNDNTWIIIFKDENIQDINTLEITIDDKLLFEKHKTNEKPKTNINKQAYKFLSNIKQNIRLSTKDNKNIYSLSSLIYLFTINQKSKLLTNHIKIENNTIVINIDNINEYANINKFLHQVLKTNFINSIPVIKFILKFEELYLDKDKMNIKSKSNKSKYLDLNIQNIKKEYEKNANIECFVEILKKIRNSACHFDQTFLTQDELKNFCKLCCEIIKNLPKNSNDNANENKEPNENKKKTKKTKKTKESNENKKYFEDGIIALRQYVIDPMIDYYNKYNNKLQEREKLKEIVDNFKKIVDPRIENDK